MTGGKGTRKVDEFSGGLRERKKKKMWAWANVSKLRREVSGSSKGTQGKKKNLKK